MSSSSTRSTTTSSSSYTVKSGDTVSHIALRPGASVSAIIKANNRNSKGFIRVGQKLTIPGASSGQASTSKPAASNSSTSKKQPVSSTTYTVKAGDTVSHIAVRTGVSVQPIIDRRS